MLEWVDAEIAKSMRKVERKIGRILHFEARSRGQRKRYETRRVARLGRP